MKKIISLLLCLATLLSLAACSSSLEGTETGEEVALTTAEAVEKKTEEKGPITLPEGFSAGFARVTLNPDAGTGLGGYSNADTRLSNVVLDDICYTVTALSDGKEVFLLLSCDNIGVGEKNYKQFAKNAEALFGIPAKNVIANATHTHASVSIYTTSAPGVAGYLKKLYPAVKNAMEEAIRDLAPATLNIGSANTNGLNYVRRYIETATGKFIGNWPEDNLDPTKYHHETQPDTQLQVIRFDREEKKDIVICNWQCHPTSAGSSSTGQVSADWIGALRKEVEKVEDVHFSYHQGGAGNLVASGKLQGDKNNSDYIAHGKKIAAVVSEALDNATPATWAPFKAEQVNFKSMYSAAYKEKNGIKNDSIKVFLNALSIGDVAFATTPCELHDTLGRYVKENSPFKMTFMCAYSNGSNSYVPSKEACANGGYEPNSYHFEVGTGEKWVEQLVSMLNTQYSK